MVQVVQRFSVNKPQHKKDPGVVRIIGGKWRARQIKVITHPGLRPTPDRVRETVFNWLMADIVNARCLDLFAGSGVLGFEALSRGAQSVTFLDKYISVVKALKDTATRLGANNQCNIVLSDALPWLRREQELVQEKPFDVIFLDPPFASPLLQKSMDLLAQSHLVTASTLIYLEAPQLLTPDKLPPKWQLLKQKLAGEVAYHLVQGADV
jgi:16S rRNA (guanine966-N2)-methyltransferase